MKTAVIFGVTGQDGSYLSELLLAKGYRVIGVSRRVSVPTDQRIKHLFANANFEIVHGDVTDAASVDRIVRHNDPSDFPMSEKDSEDFRYEIYNLAAQSHVGVSFDQPALTTNATYIGALNILEAIRNYAGPKNKHGRIRFYQASSSEMFGSTLSVECGYDQWDVVQHFDVKDGPPKKPVGEPFQNEDTPMSPNSPYAIAKLAAHNLCRVYREAHGIFACSGILFNHESERRGEQFVTRKITKYLAELDQALAKGHPNPTLMLGNLDARRDWGHAEDYVRGMWLMLQQEKPDDYVLATGESHTVRDFLMKAFEVRGIPFHGSYVGICQALFRPCEVPFLKGDATKARTQLGWKPEVSFDDLVRRMVYSDVRELETGKAG